LANDVKAYSNWAKGYFYQENCPKGKEVMTDWSKDELDECAKYTPKGNTRSKSLCC